MKIQSIAISCALSLSLFGCGGSSNEEGPIQPDTTKLSTFSLGISDAPVNGLKEVNVVFNNITLKSDTQQYSFDIRSANNNLPTMVNLLDYTGSNIFPILGEQVVAAGQYQWLRATVVNGDNNNLSMTSHVVYQDDTLAPLIVKRKGNDGIGEIQVNGFTLNQTSNNFVLEFDLKKSLVNPNNSDVVMLKPRGVRLENIVESHSIKGTISDALIANCETDNISLAADDSSFGHAIYLYSADVEAVKDIYEDNEDSLPVNAPKATANVIFNNDDKISEFEVPFISSGNYQLAYTCTAHIDDPEIMDDAFKIHQIKMITVNNADLSVAFDISN